MPDWIPISERVHPSAQYYAYFGNHRGQDIRMAWSDSLTATWTLFNASGGSGSLNTDRAWGVDGNNTGTQPPLHGVLPMVGGRITSLTNSDFVVSNHVASPEVIVDNVNQRLVMNIHGTTQFLAQPGQGTGQRSFVTTSKYGLDINPDNGLRATPPTMTTRVLSLRLGTTGMIRVGIWMLMIPPLVFQRSYQGLPFETFELNQVQLVW